MHLLLLVLSALVDFSSALKVDLLSNQRQNYEKVFPYSLNQKKRILKSVTSMFDVYVNRQLKIDTYLAERPDIDAMPRLEKLSQNLKNVTDLEFHLTLLDIVNVQRDMYLTYTMPAPYNCLRFVQPVYFWSYGFPEEKVMITSLSEEDAVVALVPELKNVQKGDEILKVDGVDIKTHVNNLKWENHASSEAIVTAAGASHMEVRESMFVKFPERDVVEYEIKRDSGEIFTVSLPWLVEIFDHCPSSIEEETLQKRSAAPNSKSPMLKQRGQFESAETSTSEENFKLQESPNSLVLWGIYQPSKQNLGVIFFKSYAAGYNGSLSDAVMSEIQSLVTKELKDTNALLMDVSQCQFGMLQLANLLPQLFIPEFSPSLARVVKSKVNDVIFSSKSNYYNDNWKRIYQETPAGELYTKAVPYNEDVLTDQVGQIYAKPVGVLTNGNTNRDPEIFVAHMQDYGNSVIFGEFPASGGGGSIGIIFLTSYGRL